MIVNSLSLSLSLVYCHICSLLENKNNEIFFSFDANSSCSFEFLLWVWSKLGNYLCLQFWLICGDLFIAIDGVSSSYEFSSLIAVRLLIIGGLVSNSSFENLRRVWSKRWAIIYFIILIWAQQNGCSWWLSHRFVPKITKNCSVFFAYTVEFCFLLFIACSRVCGMSLLLGFDYLIVISFFFSFFENNIATIKIRVKDSQ